MKVFFDTNVILDALTERDNDYTPSKQLLRYVAAGIIEGYICAKQISDFYYIAKKYCSSKDQIMEYIDTLAQLFNIVPLLGSDIAYCLKSKMSDFEDAIIDEVACVNSVPYLVTNNIKDFEKAKSIVMHPKDLIKLLQANEQ